jgi:hypothetical protein
MPAVVIVVAEFIAAYGAYIGIALTVASYVNSSRQARRARYRAQEAARLAIKDRTVTVRSGIFPHQYVVGKAKLSGALLFADSTSDGGVNNVLDLVIGLTGHELTAIDEYYFATDKLTVDPGTGAVLTAPYSAPVYANATGSGVVNAGAVTITPPPGTSVVALHGVVIIGADPGIPNVPINTVSLVGNTILISPTYNGQTITYDYEYVIPTVSYAYLRSHLGEANQAADYALTVSHPGVWTDVHQLRGRAYIVARLGFNPDVWTSGIPDIAVVARGIKCYDPRTVTTYHTDNSALVIRHYLLASYGLGCTTDELDESSFTTAANICDEWVVVDAAATDYYERWMALLTAAAAGGTWEQTGPSTFRQRRYTCNGVFDASEPPLQVLSDMLSSCAGTLSYTGGKWRLTVGAYYAPTIAAITENDLRGPVEIVSGPGHAELFNAMRGTFVGPLNKYVETDYAPVKNPAYLADDGNELIYGEQPLPFTNDSLAAQRIAKITLDRERQAIRVALQLKLVGLQLRPGDVFPLTLPRAGWTNKPFRVEKWEFTTDGDMGVNILAQEEAAASYDWNLGAATVVDPEPNTNLPSPWVVPDLGPLTVLSGTAQLLKMADGSITTRARVEWTPPTDLSVTEVHVEYKRVGGDVAYTALAPEQADSGFTYISGLQDDQGYSIRARCVNNRGARGKWSYAYHLVLGKSEAPPDLTGFTLEVIGGGMRRYTFTAPLNVIDGGSIRIRYAAGSTNNWAAMTEFHAPIVYNPATSSYSFESALPPNGTYSFGVKLYDTSGNESTNARIIQGAVLTNAPMTLRSSANRLTNSDWAEDLGFGSNLYADARALRGWAPVVQSPWTMGRNYANGSAWNIGNGGCWFYAPGTPALGTYCYIYHSPKYTANIGEVLEAHVRCNPHRTSAWFILRCWNASLTEYYDIGTDSLNPGAGIGTSDPRSIDAMPVMFASGRTPEIGVNASFNCAYVELILGVTAQGYTDPYCFWHQAMLCTHNVGTVITKETRTPYVAGSPSTMHGGTLVGATVTQTVTSSVASGYWANQSTDPGQVGFDNATNINGPAYVNNTAQTVQCYFSLQGYFSYSDVTGAGIDYADFQPVVRIYQPYSLYLIGSGSNPQTDALHILTHVAQGIWMPYTFNFLYPLAPGEGIWFYGFASVGRYTGAVYSGRVNWRQLNWQIQVIIK